MATVAVPSVDRLDLAVDDVGLADEVGDELRRGRIVELARRALLRDAALLHHHDAVRDGQRLLLIVGDVDGGEAEALLQLADLGAHAAAQAGVEVRQRLVEQQHLRLEHQRAGDGDALLLAARKLGRQAVAHPAETHEVEPALGGGAGVARPSCRPTRGRRPRSARRSCAGRARRTGTPSRRRGGWPAGA